MAGPLVLSTGTPKIGNILVINQEEVSTEGQFANHTVFGVYPNYGVAEKEAEEILKTNCLRYEVVVICEIKAVLTAKEVKTINVEIKRD